MRHESVDSRVLAAVRLLDGETALPLTSSLEVRCASGRVVRNRSGLYALTTLPGFESYAEQFEAPPAPPSTSITLTATDPSGRHQPRSFSFALPRDTTAPPVDLDSSLFTPVDVRMYLSPMAQPMPGSAVVRLSITNSLGQVPGRTVIRLTVTLPDGPAIVALGLSDERGEVLLLVPRIPVIRWGQDTHDNLINTTFPATLESASAPSAAGLPDPDVSGPAFTLLLQNLQVASGLEIHRRIQLPTP